MLNHGKLNYLLLCAASTLALATAAQAQTQGGASVESVTVTGSRVISDPLNSPTPLTVVSTADLAQTTPTDIPDALNKLPIFQNTNAPVGVNASSGGAGTINALNLRNFGAQRTLVMLDGHRVVPALANGVVAVDNLPEMLVKNVEIVTGGASAVYGSDAVTGVVNYILDKNFTGLKIDTNAGISNYGDALSYKFGIAGGTELFGGRGHLEGSLRHYSADPVNNMARPFGQQFWEVTGAGTATNPYVNSQTQPAF